MLWILFVVGGIGTVIFFLIAVIEIFSNYRDWSNIRSWGKKMVICMALGTVGFLGLYGIECLSYNETSQTGDWELVSITDDSQISGKGSGGVFYVHVSIDTNEVYSFYYQVNDAGVKRGKIDADTTTIYEKDDCTPHIVEYTTYTKNKMNGILRIILAFSCREPSRRTYEIYTPTGTILTTFDLDSQ